jgi:hypothetical protein
VADQTPSVSGEGERNREQERNTMARPTQRVLAAVAITILAATTPVLTASSAGADDGDASGLSGQLNVPIVGPVVIPPTPLVTLPPGGSTQVLGVDVPGAVSAGVLNAASNTNAAGDVVSSASVADAAALGVLTAGVVSADCVGDAGNSTLVSTTIAGFPINVSVPPNTGFQIPGVVGATLNEQQSSDGGITVRAIHLTVPLLGEIIISEAHCTTADVAGASTGGPGTGAPVTAGVLPLTG